MKVNKLLITSIIACTLGTVGIGAVLHGQIQNKEECPIVSTIDKSNGIRVKRSTTGTNSNGKDYIKFSYSLEPANTLQKAVTVSAAYKNGGSCSNVLAVDLDESNKEITVTCLSNFTEQIVLTVTCKQNTNIKATATIDYKARISNATLDTDSINQLFEVSNGEGYSNAWTILRNDELPNLNTFNIYDKVNIEKIDGSIDIDATNYKLSGTILTPYNECITGPTRDEQALLQENEEFNVGIRNLIWNGIVNGETALENYVSDIYELANGDTDIIDHLNTVAQSSDIYDGWDGFEVTNVKISFPDLNQTFECENIIISYSLSGMTIPSEYFVSTTGVSLENNSFVF